jgi:uncharacterized protein (DUF1330 family)
MYYLTQLIYLRPGGEATFDEFENVAIPLIEKYNGKLLFRVRPDKDSYIAVDGESPYEIHLISFTSKDDFIQFGQNPERARLLHLKEQSVEKAILIEGNML